MSESIPINSGASTPARRVVDFVSLQEPFCRYLLADGTEVKMKLVVTEFREVVGVTDQSGAPVYEYSCVPVMRVAKAEGGR